MSILRIYRGNSKLRVFSASFMVIVAMGCCWISLTISAQSQIPQAHITSITGVVTLQRNRGGNFSPSTLKRGDLIQLNDIIDTGKGSVVIAMGDGSQITVFPNSRVILKDFSSTASWRDLLDVVVGRVRARISRPGNRPNPYRVYSPIASIAVRGTDFLVIVEANTETRVLVYEGLVEVSSLVNPQKSVLVRPGRNIIVRPDGDISLVTAAPRGELNEIRSLRTGFDQNTNLRTAFTSHERNYTDLRPSRFIAFNDSHLDSLQNPAFATEFRQSAGRFYLIPSFSPEIATIYSTYNPDQDIQPKSVISSNYTISPQLSYFAPLGSKIVVGGGVAMTKTEIGGDETNGPFTGRALRDSLKDGDIIGLIPRPDPPDGQHIPEDSIIFVDNDGRAKFTTANVSLMVARRLGREERTSLGIKFDYLGDRSSYSLDTNWTTNIDSSHEEGKARSRTMGWSAGITHDFGGDKKLGIYYRYSLNSIRVRSRRTEHLKTIELKNFFTYSPDIDDEAIQRKPGHISEVGALFRGSLTQRLFYGVESSVLIERRSEESRYMIPGDYSQIYLKNRHIKRGLIGTGIGYAFRPRTVLSLDISAGRTWGKYRIHHPSFVPGLIYLDNYGDEQSNFWSLHLGGQTDLWRNLFAGGSLFINRDRARSSDAIDGRDGIYLQQASYEKYSLSNFSAGWRISPSWITQYTYFTSYGRNSPSHSLMFRYEFGGKKQSNESR